MRTKSEIEAELDDAFERLRIAQDEYNALKDERDIVSRSCEVCKHYFPPTYNDNAECMCAESPYRGDLTRWRMSDLLNCKHWELSRVYEQAADTTTKAGGGDHHDDDDVG